MEDRLGRDLVLCESKQKSGETMNNKSIQQKGLSLPSRVSSKSRQETAVDKKDRPRLLLFGCRATKEAADEELCVE